MSDKRPEVQVQREENTRDKQGPPVRVGIPTSQFSEPRLAPGDVRKSFREDGGTVEQHLVKECPPAVLDEVFSPSVTVAEADGSGMIIMKNNWRVETLENGTKMLIDYSSAVSRKTSRPFSIPGAEMV